MKNITTLNIYIAVGPMLYLNGESVSTHNIYFMENCKNLGDSKIKQLLLLSEGKDDMTICSPSGNNMK